MICNTIGLTADSFETLYVHGGEEVPEVYGGINYAQPVFYSLKTLTGATSYSFMGYPEQLKSYEISGNLVQNGTPTPTSPIYPQECGDIWNHWNGTLVRYHLGKIPGVNEVSEVANGAMFMIEAVPNVDYTVGQDSSPAASLLLIYRSNNPLVEDARIVYDSMVEWDGTGTPKATINSGNFKYIWIQFGGTWYDSYGASATISLVGDYAIPITCGGETKNIYLTEPIRKIGNYADVVNSDGTVTRRIVKLVFDGTENWVFRSGEPSSTFFIEFIGARFINNAALCTHYSNQDSGNFDELADKHVLTYLSLDGAKSYIGLRDSSFPSAVNLGVKELKAYLAAQYAAGTPVTIWYAIETPTTETITSPSITPITGSNTLSIDTTLAPSSVSITGHVKPTSG